MRTSIVNPRKTSAQFTPSARIGKRLLHVRPERLGFELSAIAFRWGAPSRPAHSLRRSPAGIAAKEPFRRSWGLLFAGVPSLGEALNSAAALAAAAIPGRLLHDSITGDYLTVLIISLAVVLLLLFNGWKGWEMVYRHGVGVWKQVRARGEALRWIPFRGPA